MGASNPLDAVQFFEQYDDSYSFSINSETQNSMMPQNYRVRTLCNGLGYKASSIFIFIFSKDS